MYDPKDFIIYKESTNRKEDEGKSFWEEIKSAPGEMAENTRAMNRDVSEAWNHAKNVAKDDINSVKNYFGYGKDSLQFARDLGKSDYEHGHVGITTFETEEEQNAYYEGVALAEENDMARNDPNPVEDYDGRFGSWTGKVKSANNRKEDDFLNYLKDISRG